MPPPTTPPKALRDDVVNPSTPNNAESFPVLHPPSTDDISTSQNHTTSCVMHSLSDESFNDLSCDAGSNDDTIKGDHTRVAATDRNNLGGVGRDRVGEGYLSCDHQGHMETISNSRKRNANATEHDDAFAVLSKKTKIKLGELKQSNIGNSSSGATKRESQSSSPSGARTGVKTTRKSALSKEIRVEEDPSAGPKKSSLTPAARKKLIKVAKHANTAFDTDSEDYERPNVNIKSALRKTSTTQNYATQGPRSQAIHVMMPTHGSQAVHHGIPLHDGESFQDSKGPLGHQDSYGRQDVHGSQGLHGDQSLHDSQTLYGGQASFGTQGPDGGYGPHGRQQSIRSAYASLPRVRPQNSLPYINYHPYDYPQDLRPVNPPYRVLNRDPQSLMLLDHFSSPHHMMDASGSRPFNVTSNTSRPSFSNNHGSTYFSRANSVDSIQNPADLADNPHFDGSGRPKRTLGRIFIDGGHSVITEQCPCCRRGFEGRS